MTIRAGIQERIVPVTVAAVILATAFFSYTKMLPVGTAMDVIVWLLLLIAFCAMFSILPAVVIIYGWHTGNKAGAFIAGTLALPLFFIAGFFLLRLGNMVFLHPAGIIPFIAVLSAICGLAGYCAARRTKNYLAASVVLTGLWLVVWMGGIN
jgi:hypothetical protein